MEISGKVIEINLDTDLLKSGGGGGTYKGWLLKYHDSQGKEQKLFKPSLTLKKIKGLKEALLALSEGDTFSATMEKEGNYWELKELRKGANPLAHNQTSYSGTSESSDRRQTSIVRQNCLSHATALVTSFSANPDMDGNVGEVKRIAEELEAWVNRE